MSFSIGIVGLPNVGKSTLFTALTKKQVDAANYPFCTIDPNVGTVPVPDGRLEQLAAVYNSAKVIPTVIEFVDIAGLVAGAHKGEGLGNKFLSHIREVDAICQVVREFQDSNVIHVNNSVDPESDKQTINMELMFADLSTVERRLAEVVPRAKSGDKESQGQVAVLEKARDALNHGTILSQATLTDDERLALRDLHLLTMKPMLYVLNVAETDIAKAAPGHLVISAKIEAELASMSPADAREYLQSLGMQQTGLDRLITAAYELLGLITFFTAGPTETRAWTIPRGATAPQAGAVIHTDFQEKFIRAEVTPWQDIVECGGEVKAKELGKVRTEGKEYVVQDGDTIFFRI
ncbi:MAG: redox-regulated ATPase YchF [Patescibacteria group bacterium]